MHIGTMALQVDKILLRKKLVIQMPVLSFQHIFHLIDLLVANLGALFSETLQLPNKLAIRDSRYALDHFIQLLDKIESCVSFTII